MYQNALVSTTLSLDDLKVAYAIEGAVKHSVLTDAFDLIWIHQASLLQSPNPKAVQEIVECKLVEQHKVIQKQQGKLLRIMKERFSRYIVLKCPVRLYPEIVEQFCLWEERDHSFCINIQRDGITLDGRELPKEQTEFSMRIDIEEIPSVILSFTQGRNVIEKKYLSIYRNAIMIEDILKRTLQHGNS